VGSWAEEEAEPAEAPSPRAPRTHLVIHLRDDRAEAQLFTWESGAGPRRYELPSELLLTPVRKG